MWSSPPIHGAKVVEVVLSDKQLTQSWHDDLTYMSSRMADMRKGLIENLAASGSQCDWSHIQRQIGMFAYTGMTKDHVVSLRDNHGIYMTMDGRISICGL